jgi:3-ketosteroid 9alpha-monooxygenase subunit A
MYAHGWYCVAFESELDGSVTPVVLETQRIMLVRYPTGVRAFSADCPHRGAHLAIGGRKEGDHIICPYHGYRVRLGYAADGWSVREYETLVCGGAVYVRLSTARDNGWRSSLRGLCETHDVSPGLTISLSTTMQSVIENAFDRLHFLAIHRLAMQPFVVCAAEDEPLVVEGAFRIPERGVSGVDASYRAIAISPGLILVQLGGQNPYGVITGAVSTSPATSVARLSFVFPKGSADTAEGRQQHTALARYSRQGLAEDDAVWRHVSRSAIPRWTADDEPIRQFHEFCRNFEDSPVLPTR